jgi:hypothetical protein
MNFDTCQITVFQYIPVLWLCHLKFCALPFVQHVLNQDSPSAGILEREGCEDEKQQLNPVKQHLI